MTISNDVLECIRLGDGRATLRLISNAIIMPERTVDRELQKLRQAGKIECRSKRWWRIVEATEEGP